MVLQMCATCGKVFVKSAIVYNVMDMKEYILVSVLANCSFSFLQICVIMRELILVSVRFNATYAVKLSTNYHTFGVMRKPITVKS
jgi:hypothetical protein